MISIVLYDDNSLLRIATKAMKYFSNRDFRTTDDSIWIEGLYLRFYSNMITFNGYSTAFPKENIYKCLNYILSGEEVFVMDENKKIYLSDVNESTNFYKIFCGEVV